MSRYIEILAEGDYSPIGLDANQRILFSANFRARVAGTDDRLEEEIARLIVDANLAMGINTDIFLGPAGGPPPTNNAPGPFIGIIRTYGYAPYETHNGGKDAHRTFQIIVRATSYIVARNRMNDIWEALDGKRDVTVTAA